MVTMAKIRVLQVIPALTLGGISSVVMNWIRHIDSERYQFDIITFNDGPLRGEIEQLGGRIFVIPTLRQSPINYFKELKVIFGATRYNVIHVHNSFKNGIMLWLAKKADINIRVCHSHTSGVENKWLLPVISLLKKIAITQSNRHVACGNDAGKFLYGVKPFILLNNAISVEKFLRKEKVCKTLKQRFSFPSDKKIILHVGRFSEVKNHKFILQLAGNMLLDPDIHFVCVGNGPLKSEIKKSILEKKLQSQVTLLPVTSKIPELLHCANAFILPSLFEGLSVALLEAQASSLPCFISETIPEDSDMGLNLVRSLPFNKPELWVEQLNNISAPSLNHDVILSAFNDRGFSTEVVLNELDRIYQSVDI
jgi:glycosyltransferase EpsF